ncbi:hypothetical protein [Aquibaculum sediminis]|uniref:hypothetical protein n=1 Tax=Aquibaculum sediminis TaxID=3231907 RepID=UPI0034538DDD
MAKELGAGSSRARRALSGAGALVCGVLLTGCAGAMMAAGPVAFPLALIAMEPMEAMGVFDEMDTAMAPSTNPTMQDHPALADGELSAMQAQLIARHTVFVADVDGHVSSFDARDCALGRDVELLLVHRLSESGYEDFAASFEGTGARMQPLQREAALLEGECEEGAPEGDFVAVTNWEYSVNSATFVSRHAERQRLEGEMRDRRFEGAMLLDRVSDMRIESLQSNTQNIAHSMLHYENGEPVGQHLQILYTYDNPSEPPRLLTIIHEYVTPSLMKATTYAGKSLFQEFTTVDGKNHGWMVAHPVEFVEGYPSDASRTCFQYGKEAPAEACEGSAQTSSLQAPGLLPAIQQAAAVR